MFRFNQRFYPMAGFATLLGLSTELAPSTADTIHGPLPAGHKVCRRGRATGLTSVNHLTRPPTPRTRNRQAAASVESPKP